MPDDRCAAPAARPRRQRQRACRVRGDRVAVAEAGHLRAQRGQPSEGRDGPVAVHVEHPEDHPARVGCCRHRVPGEQHPVCGEMERDAAVGVPRHMDHPGTAAEVQHVPVGHLGHLLHGDRLGERQPLCDLGMDRQLPLLEHRWRTREFTPDHRRVQAVGQHVGSAQGGKLGSPADVVLVEMGEDDLSYRRGGPAERGQRGRDRPARAGRAGVDQGRGAGVRVVPQVGLTHREAQQVQPGEQLDDIHLPNVGRTPVRRRGSSAVDRAIQPVA